MNVRKRRWVQAAAALSLVLLGSEPLWAQGKDRGGRGGGGRQSSGRQESGGGRQSSGRQESGGARQGSGRQESGGARQGSGRQEESGGARQQSGRGDDGNRARRESAAPRDATPRTITPRESTRLDSTPRDGARTKRDGDRARRIDATPDRIATPRQSPRDSDVAAGLRDRDGDRDRDRDRRHRDRDFDDDRFSFGFNVGPFSAFYGRPGYRYWGPWGGFYGPSYGYYGPGYGYYGPWSGYYGSGWPYYTEIPVEERIYTRAYFDPEAPDSAEPANSTMVSDEGLQFQRRAEDAFRSGRYDDAVRFANHAAVEMPQNGPLFLFISHALFAVGDYGAAAGAAHQGMAMSQPRDWGLFVQNFRRYYGNAADYTEQVRRLEKFVSENDDAAYARFLLGYHYGFLGYPEEARRELNEAIALDDSDELAIDLLEQFGGTAPTGARRSNRSEPASRPERDDAGTESATPRGGRQDRNESLSD